MQVYEYRLPMPGHNADMTLLSAPGVCTALHDVLQIYGAGMIERATNMSHFEDM